MTLNQPIPAAQYFPEYFSTGVLYHCGEEFFIVRNPRFLDVFTVQHPLAHLAYIVVTCGEIEGKIDGQELQVAAGSSVLVFAKQYIQIARYSEDFECLFIFFTQKVADALFSRQSYALFQEIQKNPIVPLDILSMRVMEGVYQLLETTLSFPEADQMMDICISLLNISFRLAIFPNPAELEVKPSKSREEKLTRLFLDVLERHYRSHREVSFYAGLLSVTPKYLSTCIKNVTGYPANQWINKYVIRDAEKLLTNSTTSIKSIAAQLGFDDQLLFGKYFRRQTGMSPTDYRCGKGGRF